MSRTRQQPQLIDLPLSSTIGEATATFLASSGDHAKFFKDGFDSAYAATKRDSTARRNAVRTALIAKYNLK